jgi:hypothetical protein
MNEKTLVIGGAFQGKLNFVCEKFHYTKEQVVKGEAFFETGLESKGVLYGFHYIMKRWIEEKKNPEDLVALLLKAEGLEIIISDEIGLGVVPLEKDERFYREQTGRALCKIAEEAKTVYRVHCGLPIKIKG